MAYDITDRKIIQQQSINPEHKQEIIEGFADTQSDEDRILAENPQIGNGSAIWRMDTKKIRVLRDGNWRNMI